MYVQANGVKCTAWRKYSKTLTLDSKNIAREKDARLDEFEVTMEGLNLPKIKESVAGILSQWLA